MILRRGLFLEKLRTTGYRLKKPMIVVIDEYPDRYEVFHRELEVKVSDFNEREALEQFEVALIENYESLKGLVESGSSTPEVQQLWQKYDSYLEKISS